MIFFLLARVYLKLSKLKIGSNAHDNMNDFEFTN